MSKLREHSVVRSISDQRVIDSHIWFTLFVAAWATSHVHNFLTGPDEDFFVIQNGHVTITGFTHNVFSV